MTTRLARLAGIPLLLSMVVMATPTAAQPPTTAANAAPVTGQRLQDRLADLGRQSTAKDRPSAAAVAGTTAAKGANPWTSLMTPDQRAELDMGYWRDFARQRSARDARPKDRVAVDAGFERVYREDEPAGLRGANDTLATAEFVRGVGTGAGDRPQVSILGTLAPSFIDEFARFAEDDGALPLAGDLALRNGRSVQVASVIGNGPYGTRVGDGTGDFDWWRLGNLRAGDTIVVDVDTPNPFGDLDPTLTMWDGDGFPIAFNDDDSESFDSYLTVRIPAAGEYYVSMEGFGSFQQDPFDSGSGIGAGSEGRYTATFGRNASDVDMFSVALEPGDVVSASVAGSAGILQVFAPDGTEVMGSAQDASFIYPASTQLTGGGNAVVDHVVATRGRYRLAVSGGSGTYEATLRILRPGYEQLRRARQVVFLDFDGAEVNTGIFFGPGVRELSPLSAFMGRWGLRRTQTRAVADQVEATVRENLRADLRQAGLDTRVDIVVRNSFDHPDPFGGANVSRVIVGGSIEESGIPTIGIAQSIDPGNFGRTDTALVLLDVLSDPRGPFGDPSLNSYLRPASDRVGFVGRAVGNVVSHEIGHFIGNWHVEPFNEAANLMDPGGDFPVLYGVGPDRIGGTDDDVDVDFGADTFEPFEGFTGTEDTTVRSGYGLTGNVTLP